MGRCPCWQRVATRTCNMRACETHLIPPGPSWPLGLGLLGNHESACANSGVLAVCAVTLERAVAHVCRAATATVACNVVRVTEAHIDVPIVDDTRIEAVVRAGRAQTAAHLPQAHMLVAGLAPRRRHSSAVSHGTALLRCRPCCAQQPNPCGFPDGQRSWPLLHIEHAPAPCSSCRSQVSAAVRMLCRSP